MKLGNSNHHPLTTWQSRTMLLVSGVIAVVVVISALSHLTFYQMRAMVVGNTVDLSSQAEGRIAEICFAENETYRRGDALVRLNNDALHVKVASVEHEIEEIQRSSALERSGQGLERRRFELQTDQADTEAKLASAQIEIDRIDSVIDGLEARRDATQQRLDRAEELLAQGAMTAAEVENRRKSAIEARCDYEEAVSKRRLAASEVGRQDRILELMAQRMINLESDRTGLLTELEIKLADKESELSQLRALIEELEVRADYDGVVTSVLRKPGEWVTTGQPILSVMTADDMWVEVYLPPSDKQSVQRGDRVEVRVNARGGVSLSGRVDRILPVLRPFPDGSSFADGRTYAVLVVHLDDIARARNFLSPQQQVVARIRRSWGLLPGGNANAGELPRPR